MAIRIADIYANLSVKTEDYDKGLNAAQGKATAFGSVFQGILQGVGQAAFRGIVTGLERTIDSMAGAVTKASDLNETMSKVNVIFGESAKAVFAFADTADTALGQSKQQALDAISTFAVFGKSAGLSGQELVDFSTKFDTLASDLASFNNTTPEQAITAIGAALRGESEPIRAYQVLLDDATLRQQALALGITKTTKDALTPQQRVLAATAQIYAQTGIQQGDFARTAGGMANATRILNAELTNGATKMGQVFLPAVEAITNGLVGIAPKLFSYGQNIIEQFANGLASGIRAIIPVVNTIRSIMTYWFKPGSPPKVLPDIDKWGAGAMKAYLDGFLSVDMKGAFDSVGSAIEGILRSNVAAGKMDEGSLVSRIFGTRDAIAKAVSEFARVGSVSEASIQRIVRSAGSAGVGIGALVKAYFDVQKASTAASRAQDELNRITEQYDGILDPLRGKLDDVRAQQQKLANQQRLIAANNTLNNFESTAAEKQAAALEIQQIALEDQISTVEQQKKVKTDAAQASLDGAKKEETAAQKQLDAAQAVIDQQVKTNTLLGEQRSLEEQLATKREAEAEKQKALAEALHQAQLQYNLGIADTQGKLAILRGELASTTAGSAEYYGILGQIAALEKQSADEAKQNADKIADAQFDYNLELADTAGKIALWQQKLGTVQEGSSEYFSILSRIHSLTEQLNKEQDKMGTGALGVGSALDTNILTPLQESNKAASNLLDAVNELFGLNKKKLMPSQDVKNQPQNFDFAVNQLAPPKELDQPAEPPQWIKNIVIYIKTELLPMFDGAKTKLGEFIGFMRDEFPKAVKPMLDTFNELLRVIKIVFPQLSEDSQTAATGIFGFWQEHGDILGKSWKLLWEDITAVFTFAVNFIVGTIHILIGLFTADFPKALEGVGQVWSAIWNGLYDVLAGVFGIIKIFLDEFAPKLAEPLENTVERVKAAGRAFVTNFLAGLQEKWTELKAWFWAALKSVTDLLPGSEPVDSSSPLTGLGDRGRALVNNFWDGIKEVWLTLSTWWTTTLTAFVTVISTYWESIKTAGSNLLGQLKSGFDATWKTIADWWNGTTGVLPGFLKAVTDLGTKIKTGGANLIGEFLKGMQSGWDSVSTWFGTSLQSLRDKLPFSEPKDPTSPLRGLAKSGAAMIDMFQSGINSASLNINPLANSLLAAPAGATTTNTSSAVHFGPGSIAITIAGNANADDVRKGVNNGVLDALRASGVAI